MGIMKPSFSLILCYFLWALFLLFNFIPHGGLVSARNIRILIQKGKRMFLEVTHTKHMGLVMVIHLAAAVVMVIHPTAATVMVIHPAAAIVMVIHLAVVVVMVIHPAVAVVMVIHPSSGGGYGNSPNGSCSNTLHLSLSFI
ncbi:hypothetical protein E1A91_A01G010500v1 [Gossypium mustelinum]|uniref:Uncharacterized protein n=1 Tax=Gossypium mustelinum TaxID=34275 RepID=A0A5D3AA07_GOSMU|nr:hypothetical protein E1A91_A01G010500v1 [Gossypium mustelinum]